ncbi:hypothetical protein C8J56DRAFT_350276 [Mycena floridula]|nr:hypothetical protein C8J56DRAFT_350276 [Mycena floridula]
MPHVPSRASAHAARTVKHRDYVPVSAVEATAKPNNAYVTDMVSSMSSTTRTASIVFGVVAAVIFIGLAIWRIRCWKQKSMKQKPVAVTVSTEKLSFDDEKKRPLEISTSNLEKPKAVYQLRLDPPSAVDEKAGWAPQVTTYRGVPMTTKQLLLLKSSPKKYAQWEKKVLNLDRAPPPSFYTKGPGAIPMPPTPPEPAKGAPTPPTPPATRSRALLPPSPPAEPLPSPARSTSFSKQQSKSMAKPSHYRSASSDSKVMKVINTFVPSLPDELKISVGDSVRFIEQHDDGWCTVQLLGKSDSQRGVIPRFCIVDRPSLARGNKQQPYDSYF